MKKYLSAISLLIAVLLIISAVGCKSSDLDELTQAPTTTPTEVSTEKLTEVPTVDPTEAPTTMPTDAPTEAPTDEPSEAPTDAPTEAPTDAPSEAPTDAPTEAPTEKPTEMPTEPPIDKPVDHTYIDFTPSEKSQLQQLLGEVIPFIPNDEYYFEDYTWEEYGEYGFNFYTFGNTEEEFEAYLDLFSNYTNDGTEVDEYGDTWYFFSKGDLYVDLSYYWYEDGYIVDVYAYIVDEDNLGGSTDNPTDEPTDTPTDHIYVDFSSSEKSQLQQLLGEVIPFIPNDEYYFEDYTWEEYGEYGFNFYTFGNTEEEFEAYLDLFLNYTNDGTEVDEYGDTWYFFCKGDLYVDLSYYWYEDGYIVDVYAYIVDEDNLGGDFGDWEDPEDPDEDVDLITNNGAGLPEDDGDGIYDIDFTEAENVKNVTQQGYYLDGCPTVGSPAILVIPVEFSDVTAQGNGYSIENIQKIFNGTSQDLNYYSVHDYFFTSSYGALDLDITVLDEWFRPKYNSRYYENSTMDYYGYEIANGDQLILDEALAYLSTIMDLSEFDSDGNGMIDAVILVNTLEIDDTSDFHWAYRYWNMLVDEEEYYYEYDGVSANDCAWIPYQFMFECVDEYGDVNYDENNELNPYAFIHEFSHVLGSDDYYDTAYVSSPLGGYDVMDEMVGDHNPYSKFNFGWVTSSKLITTDSSVTVTLENFSKNGDTIIIANNWDATLGAYQEYYVIMYYTADGLNGGVGGYFTSDGVVVYHVNASLYREEMDGEIYYDVYNTNTDESDSEYGTKNNLIEYVKSADDHYTYVEGDALADVYDDSGNKLGYTFTVESIDGDFATVIFEKVA